MSDAVQTQSNSKFKKRVFSGIQPSGGPTLGNYLGAVKRFVHMQNENFETIYCMVDLHAITVWQDPEKLKSVRKNSSTLFVFNRGYLRRTKNRSRIAKSSVFHLQ